MAIIGRVYRPPLLVALLVLAAPGLAASPDAIRAEYIGVQRDLAHGDDGRPRDWKTPEAARLIERAWRLVGARAAAHLAAHAHTSAQHLEAAVNELNPPEAPSEPYDAMDAYLEKNPYHLFVNAARVADGDRGVYLMTAYFRKPLYDRRIELFMIEGMASGPVHVTRAPYDGPCERFHPLSATVSGHLRVLASEEYSPIHGCTASGHVRFLEWDGRAVRTLLHREYHAGGNVWDVRVEGERVYVKSKGSTAVLFDCPCCSDIQATAKFRVGADHVEDLGLEYAVPQIALIDGFLDRALHRGNPSSFGTRITT